MSRSDREQLHADLTRWLEERRDQLNAPYGVLSGIRRLRTGAVRTITFGRARTLDATLTIWTPNRMRLHTNVGTWEIHSPAEFYALMAERFGVR